MSYAWQHSARRGIAVNQTLAASAFSLDADGAKTKTEATRNSDSNGIDYGAKAKTEAVHTGNSKVIA